MAMDAGEAAFWGMLRALATVIGWFFTSLFWLLSAIFDAITFAIYRKHDEKRKEEQTLKDEQTFLGPNADTAALEDQAATLVQRAAFPDQKEFLEGFFERYLKDCRERNTGFATWGVRWPLLTATAELYMQEGLDEPPSKRVLSGAIDAGRYRDELLAHARKIQDPGKTLEVLARTLNEIAVAVTTKLPPFALQGFDDEDIEPDQTTSIPLIEALAKPGAAIEAAMLPFFAADVRELGLFKDLRAQLDAAYEREGHLPAEDERPGREILNAYLQGTYLAKIFEGRVPFEVPFSRRMEHTAIVAGSGWGKTQLLQSMIAGDLALPDPPALVIIDSTGAMVRRLQRLAIFNDRLKDRLIIIDPERDAPALNMFDVSNPRLQGYSDELKQSVESDVVELFNYVFQSNDNPLTARMETAFSYVVRLLLSIPHATIHTLRELLQENPKSYEQSAFREHIDKLDDNARSFFERQFFGMASAGTREQIAQRLYGVTSVPAFERMFSTVNKLDMFAELNRGSCIVVNTSEQMLKGSSVLFGRYMIARVLAATFERGSIPEDQRQPAFLIVDEAAPYFDETFEKLLTRVRQFKLGVTIAFQHLEQASEKLRSAIASNTSVKYAGGVGFTDRRWLARDMETTPEFIQAQRKDSTDPPKWTQFACYVRNYTDRAVSLTVPFLTLEGMPIMSDAEHAELLERNRTRVTAQGPTMTGEPKITLVPETVSAQTETRATEPPDITPHPPAPAENIGTEGGVGWQSTK